MEVKDVRCFGVEHEANWPCALLLLFPHHVGNIVTVTEIVAEALTFVVEEETTFTTEGWIRLLAQI
jgi:hypothetical protein